MAKNVLQYVQYALTTMDSDQVDEIADTEESMQVAELLREVYYEFINREEWPWLERGLDISSAASTALPTNLTLPENTKVVWDLYYKSDDTDSFQPLKYLPPKEFVHRFSTKGGDDQLIEPQLGVACYIGTDRNPSCWTSFDDESITCDAFKSTVESTLVSDKVKSWGVFIPDFQVTNTFEPLIPRHLQPTLQALLNDAAHAYFKQQDSRPDAERVLRQMGQARRRPASTRDGFDSYYTAKFGRK